jgi:hypothetical protein
MLGRILCFWRWMLGDALILNSRTFLVMFWAHVDDSFWSVWNLNLNASCLKKCHPHLRVILSSTVHILDQICRIKDIRVAAEDGHLRWSRTAYRPIGNSLRLLPLDSTCCERHSTRTVRQWSYTSYTLSWGKQTLSGIVADLHVFIHAIHCWSIDWICASPTCAKIIHLSTVLSFERRDSGAGLLTNQLQKQEVRTLIFHFSGCDVTSKWVLSPLKGGIRQNCNEKDDKLMHHEILGFRKMWQPSYQKSPALQPSEYSYRLIPLIFLYPKF